MLCPCHRRPFGIRSTARGRKTPGPQTLHLVALLMAETTSPDVNTTLSRAGRRPPSTCSLRMRTETATGRRLSPGRKLRRQRARRRWVTLIVPPAVAFFIAELLMYVAARLDGATQDFFTPSHWARMDWASTCRSLHMAMSLNHCSGPPLYPPHSWCGTASWAPLVPWLISLLGRIGVSLPVGGMVLSILFAYLTLQAMWVLIGPAWTFFWPDCLAFAACFPGMIYYYTLSPVSLLTFLAVVSLDPVHSTPTTARGCNGALCAWAFAIGPLVGVVLLVRGRARRPRSGVLACEPCSAGVALRQAFGVLLLAYQGVGRALERLLPGSGEVRQRPPRTRSRPS